MFKDIITNMTRKFSKMFKEDDKGKRRNWVAMETAEIEKLWAECKECCEKLYPRFKIIELEFTVKTDL